MNTADRLHVIMTLFEEIEEQFTEISEEDKEIILDSHIEGHSLNHFVRWGSQNTKEVMEKFI